VMSHSRYLNDLIEPNQQKRLVDFRLCWCIDRTPVLKLQDLNVSIGSLCRRAAYVRYEKGHAERLF